MAVRQIKHEHHIERLKYNEYNGWDKKVGERERYSLILFVHDDPWTPFYVEVWYEDLTMRNDGEAMLTNVGEESW